MENEGVNLSVAQAAERLGIHQTIIYQAIRQGKLSANTDRPRTIAKDNLDQWWNNRDHRHKQETEEAEPQPAEEKAPEPLPMYQMTNHPSGNGKAKAETEILDLVIEIEIRVKRK